MPELNSFPEYSRPFSALAFDFGTQRIGVAYGQSLTGGAEPVTVLRATEGKPDWHEVASLIAQWQPDVLVIGLPFNLDGSQSELQQRAVKFANRLHGRFGLPCYGMDERLSSVEAREQQTQSRRAGSSKKNAAIDHIAAQIILQNWFSALQASKPDGSA